MLEASLLAFLREHAGQHKYVIAGGYVRDRIIGRTPRDIDVFVLNAGWDEQAAMHHRLTEAGIPTVKHAKTYRAIAGRPTFGEVIELRFLEWPVQLITTTATGPLAVIDTFDYDICQFYYTDEGLIADHPDGAGYDAIKHRRLGLRHLLTPLSSLRRGFLFEHRLGYRFPKADIAQLVVTLQRQHENSAGGWDE